MKVRFLLILMLVSMAMMLNTQQASANDRSVDVVHISEEVIQLEGQQPVTLRTLDYGSYKVSYLLPLDKQALDVSQLDSLSQHQEAKTQAQAEQPQPNQLSVNIRRTATQWSPDGKAKSFTSLNVTKTTSTATKRLKVTNAYSSLSFYNNGNADVISMVNQVCFEGVTFTVSFPPGMSASNSCGSIGPFNYNNTAFGTISAAGHEASGSAFYPTLEAVKQIDSNAATKGSSTSVAVSSARISYWDNP
ncbi:hypothetical protein SE18_08025 [Herpetosiphon geysericola]|uniref:Uncharacterized protein n=2 Tax=Herpetosiphon geysericola TaxID=70996 RepID=A0A0P6YDJ6_9CHLR|nr:hypothetical protein SE18_08025 [Herpetosiphon geysericola]